MSYILIIIMSGGTITTQDFNTYKACYEASQFISTNSKAYKATCVPKGL